MASRIFYLRCLLPCIELRLRFFLLQSCFHPSLPLPSSTASLRALDGNRHGHTTFTLCSLIRVMPFPLPIALAEGGHRCFEKGAILGMEGIELTGFNLDVLSSVCNLDPTKKSRTLVENAAFLPFVTRTKQGYSLSSSSPASPSRVTGCKA